MTSTLTTLVLWPQVIQKVLATDSAAESSLDDLKAIEEELRGMHRKATGEFKQNLDEKTYMRLYREELTSLKTVCDQIQIVCDTLLSRCSPESIQKVQKEIDYIKRIREHYIERLQLIDKDLEGVESREPF